MGGIGALSDIFEEYMESGGPSDSLRVRSTLQRVRSLFAPYMSESIKVSESDSSGLGMFSTKYITRGELILIDHPIVSVPDVDLALSPYNEHDGGDSLCLTDVISSNFSPSVEKCLRTLYPIRSNCSLVKTSSVPPELVDRLRCHLPDNISPGHLIAAVQLNSLGYYTFPELVTYDDHLRFLSGTGIYPQGSMFNHSCHPNINHYAVGDVTFFRATHDIPAGEELFISYIGRDLLVESKSIRDEFLNARDFKCACSKCKNLDDGPDPWLEELGIQERAKLRLLKSREERVLYIEQILKSHDYISRDVFELKFAMARDSGLTGLAIWNELISSTNGCLDMQSIVLRMHFLRNFGQNDTVEAELVETGRLVLGDDMGSFDFLQSLFRITDFK